MTQLLEAPPDDPITKASPAKPASSWARARIAARIARRQVRRARGSSILITLLVALPVAIVAAASVMTASHYPTPEERVRVELGQMQGWVTPSAPPGTGLIHFPDDPRSGGDGGTPTDPDAASVPLDDPFSALPPGTEALLVTEGSTRVKTGDAGHNIDFWAGPVADPRFTGRFDLRDGSRMTGDGEAMLSPAALDALQVSIGDILTLSDTGQRITVTGTLDAAFLSDDAVALFLNDGDGRPAIISQWYLPDLRLDWAGVRDLNTFGIAVFSRDVVLGPPVDDPDLSTIGRGDDTTPIVIAIGSVFAAYLVTMLSGAAFAVSARRQQRALAVAAGVGTAGVDLHRIVLLQGTVLGALGGLLGTALGIGGAAITMSLTDDGSATRYWGFHIPWLALALIVGGAVIVGTLSAWAPARTVTRGDVISALRGSRRPQIIRRSRPIWGSGLLFLGLAITAVCISGLLLENTRGYVDSGSLSQSLLNFGVIVGPIIAQLGILLAGGWLLWLVARLLSRLGLAVRLAGRDISAHASRTVPAVSAIAATVFVSVFAVSFIAMEQGHRERTVSITAPVGTTVVSFQDPEYGSVSEENMSEAATRTVKALEDFGAQRIATVWNQVNILWDQTKAESATGPWVIAIKPEKNLLSGVPNGVYIRQDNPNNPLSVIPAEMLETALGTTLNADQLREYREGAALVADPGFAESNTVEIAAWTPAEAATAAVPDNILAPDAAARKTEPQWSRTLDAIVVPLPQQSILVAIAPETAEELEMTVPVPRIFATFGKPLSLETRDQLQEHLSAVNGDLLYTTVGQGEAPSHDMFWIVPVFAAVGILVIGASSIVLALARAERRPDDATLTAVGAPKRARRAVAFWQGLIVSGFGTLTGFLTGILPPIGLGLPNWRGLDPLDIPVLPIALFAVALPLVIACASWLIPPGNPDLVRRTVIT